LSLSLILTLTAGCSLLRPEPQIQVVTNTVKTTVPIVAHPKKVQLNDVKIYVVSKENYEEFVKEYEAKNGADAYIAISVKDYENLSLNFAELRRYIEQQKQIIVYYENAVKPEEESKESTK
jgi:hypothetical protein